MSSMRTRTRCASRSIRCGRRARSTPSASTTTRRSPTGATDPHTSIARSRTSTADRDYLTGNLAGGEAFDCYYADRRNARSANEKRRSPTASASPGCSGRRTSGASGRTRTMSASDGAELASPTAWVPQSKPIWLTEVGCPAVDKGANQPSVFPDAKSSENAAPYFSNGRRDDLIQRRYLESVRGAFDPEFGATEALNPALVGLRRPHGRSVRYPSLDLGRAALSRVSGHDRSLERRSELGDRPLAERAARLRADGGADRGVARRHRST